MPLRCLCAKSIEVGRCSAMVQVSALAFQVVAFSYPRIKVETIRDRDVLNSM